MVRHQLPPITMETDFYVILGKPYSVALNDDLSEVASVLKYYGGYADKIHGQVIETSPTKLAYTIREPVGVCGQIIPFVSFPSPHTRDQKKLTKYAKVGITPSQWQPGNLVQPSQAVTPSS